MALGLAHPLHAQSREPLSPRTDWTEEWRETIPVGGGLRVGIMTETAGRAVDPGVLTVFLPPGEASLLCVEISSRDGRYEARLPYEIRGLVGPTTLRLPTRHASELRDYTDAELAILARLEEACDEGAGDYVVGTWGVAALGETIHVFLNSDVPTSILASVDRVIVDRVRCEGLEGVTTSYGLRCDVPVAWLVPGTDLHVRKRLRRSLVDVDLPIRRP